MNIGCYNKTWLKMEDYFEQIMDKARTLYKLKVLAESGRFF